MNEVTFRPEQEAILRYRGGKMGISAVPGQRQDLHARPSRRPIGAASAARGAP